MDACGLGVLCCLRRFRQPRENHTRELPQVQLDTGNMGKDFILPSLHPHSAYLGPSGFLSSPVRASFIALRGSSLRKPLAPRVHSTESCGVFFIHFFFNFLVSLLSQEMRLLLSNPVKGYVDLVQL